ncbi:hypothetical protein WA026_012733 [Henosepilachna vigintioctopunctata]|uniref:Uncharacterized protein n=1 Tax=Henosepilachna vigintioctopunctata TaxID=420089 RepID=A0AAW1U663_9CUCU
MKIYPNDLYKNQFKLLKKETNYIIRNSKQEYVNNQLTKAGTITRKIWELIKNNLITRKKETNIINKLKIRDRIITSPLDIADSLNTFFSEVALNLQKNIISQNVLTFPECCNN